MWNSIILLLLLSAAAVFVVKSKPRHRSSYSQEDAGNQQSQITPQYAASAYKQKWMFTTREKDAFNQLEPIVKEYGYRLFAKVRLFDLITPVESHTKYKSNLYRIQAKHVDFVVTKENLVAKFVIELDDSTHDREDRKQRDQFVDTVLTACGYKVLHVRTINRDEILHFLRS